MCGILGFFDIKSKLSRPEAYSLGQKMADVIAHRGPDDVGVWQDMESSLLLAQRRLSIIDLSPEGHQPKESHSGRYVISYNGEVYNFPALQQELEGLGATFRGRSDTEIMLAAFDQWGINQALQKFNGMFAFALWDRKEKCLHLVRDPMGKKPLYVGWAGSTLVFASELKSFHRHPDFKKQISRDVLSLYMRFNCVPAPHSIFENVWQLMPGSRLALDLTNLSAGTDLMPLMEQYWSHKNVVEEAKGNPLSVSDDQAVNDFEELLTSCVQDRMVSDVPLGAFLSGGIDSSAIVALMQKVSNRPVKTFTIGFEEQGFNEATFAKDVATHLGTEHHEIYVKPQDAQDVIAKLPDMYDEPFSDESQIPTYMVSHYARQHVTVALSGDGGDEMLGGYQRHFMVPGFWKRTGWLPHFMRRGMSKSIRTISAERWNELVPQTSRFGYKLHKIADLLEENDKAEVYARLVDRWHGQYRDVALDSEQPSIPLFDPAWQPRGLNFTEQLIYNDTISYMPNDILTKVDRASMAASLECRAPLLDKRIFEYAWRLPLDMKIRNGKGKWLLRQVLARHVPTSLFERPKQGFAVPVGEWMTGSLKDWAEDLLSEEALKQQGFLDTEMVRRAWDDHQQGRGNHAGRLWTVLMFQSWLKRWG